jgi:hypothetical protein
LRRPFDPNHCLEIADDIVAYHGRLGAGQSDCSIADVKDGCGLCISRSLRLVEAVPGKHGDKRQKHREGHSDYREYRCCDVIVSAAELDGQELVDRQFQEHCAERRQANQQKPDPPERVLVDHAGLHDELHYVLAAGDGIFTAGLSEHE